MDSGCLDQHSCAGSASYGCGSKWVGLQEFRQRVWWIVVLVPPALGITVFGRAVVRSAVGRVLICPGMLDERVGSMVRSKRVLGGGVLSCLVIPQRWEHTKVGTVWRPKWGLGVWTQCVLSRIVRPPT